MNCDKVNYSYEHLFKHSRTVGNLSVLNICSFSFFLGSGLSYLTRHRQPKDSKKKTCKCSICKNRKDLYAHRLNQHDRNDDIEHILPFIRDHGNNESVEVYNTNTKKYILRKTNMEN